MYIFALYEIGFGTKTMLQIWKKHRNTLNNLRMIVTSSLETVYSFPYTTESSLNVETPSIRL